MAKPVTGAQLYTLREHVKTIKDIERTLARVREIGYSTVQASGLGPVDPRELAAVVRDSGLKVTGTHTSWERLGGDLEHVIEEHKLLGCRHTALPWLPRTYCTEVGLKQLLAELAPVMAGLATAGITLSYHNHHQEFVRHGRTSWLEALYAATDPKLFKVEIDTYWVQAGGGDPAAWIARYPGRQPLLHLKDMVVSGTGDFPVRMAEVGEGNLNWPAIFSAAEKAGVEYMFVEQDDCYERDPFESLAISYRNLKAWGYP